MRLYVVSALVIAFLAILFALQNTNLVTIQLFFWEYQQSLALILLGTLAIGVIVGLLVSVPAVIRRNVRIARAQKQSESLDQLLQEKEEAIKSASQKNKTAEQNHKEMLKSLGVAEPTTGLIQQELLPKAIASHLSDYQQQADVAQLPPMSVVLFKAMPVLQDGNPLPEMFAGVAQILQQQSSESTWLYADGQGHFAATHSGLAMRDVTTYSEAVQAAVLENPPLNSAGQPIELDVSVGGAIADAPTTVDATQLLQTAEKALEQALQRGRNRVRILQAS